MWKWDLSQKIKLFIWLSVENRILTWDILQRKGWHLDQIFVFCVSKRSNLCVTFLFLAASVGRCGTCFLNILIL